MLFVSCDCLVISFRIRRSVQNLVTCPWCLTASDLVTGGTDSSVSGDPDYK